ncbi:AAA family ATPase [Anaerostipes hadrus]|uniref:AAA family ATPase n=1 Tax=Anaerostipes hadrus TaxID=649756 RepID=UPI001D027C51|nr:AAA family ATPase [Anaerostipes hadrus]MCB5543041.1 AAA family ATPase [Anaerostipes hadrus]
MFNKIRLKQILAEYKKVFVQQQWPDEKYKWEAVQCFQENWDINSADFAQMLKKSLDQVGNLLASANNFPAKMIIGFAEAAPEEVRSMYMELYDESKDLCERIANFKNKSNTLLERYTNGAAQHYQYENAIMAYLWLRYPDKYYIYKFSEVKAVSSELESDYRFKKGAYVDNIRNFMALYDEICAELQQDDELSNLLNSQITSSCYADPELRTLTIDVVFFIFRYWNKEDSTNKPLYAQSQEDDGQQYWFLNEKNPKMCSIVSMPVGEIQNETLFNENGNKCKIVKDLIDIKVGDMVIGYESTPVKQIVTIFRVSAEQDGERIYFDKLEESYPSAIDFATLNAWFELKKKEYFSITQGSLFKLTKTEYEFIIDLIHRENSVLTDEKNEDEYSKENFLDQVYMTEAKYDRLVAVLTRKKNIILQGAPGVGKTYAAKRLAYSMMGEKDDDRIEFVQFHQNYSYEDFMMGYKPVEDGFELKYGIFYRFCQKAANHPDKDYFFIIDEINRGNMSKIFGELLMLIEADYRETKTTLAYNGLSFSVPKRLHIIGMMNTADRSLAMIDYALRRRFSFFDMEPGFDSEGFIKYQEVFANDTFNTLIDRIKELNREIANDKSLGKGFCIGHSYFCNTKECTNEWMQDVVDFDILPMLAEYWFDDTDKLQRWENILHGVFQ